ncbi:pyrroloquinoline quinone biosynthesis protein [Paenibacillus sp. FSL H8-0548]|uniref:PqqD family protein n=1 Tax=Paenibacillus sp. FSL H8-0548 TaxID=1920422 RepID=UPI00096E19C3|nr:PqqD family protein [Paenibacillus sp. FSL H8-0548]OMF30783.1 pyrroloquinoline quinone biosynthesis protein [Paenibacillus sp. FSL H8-0548]
MKMVEGFSLRTIAGTNVVVPVGKANISFKGMITLNDSGVFMWKQLQSDINDSELLQAMLEEYDIDDQTAKADIREFLDTLTRAGLLE